MDGVHEGNGRRASRRLILHFSFSLFGEENCEEEEEVHDALGIEKRAIPRARSPPRWGLEHVEPRQPDPTVLPLPLPPVQPLRDVLSELHRAPPREMPAHDGALRDARSPLLRFQPPLLDTR